MPDGKKKSRAKGTKQSTARRAPARRGESGEAEDPHSGRSRAGQQRPQAPRESHGPSSRPVNEGLEGAIFDESDDERPSA